MQKSLVRICYTQKSLVNNEFIIFRRGARKQKSPMLCTFTAKRSIGKLIRSELELELVSGQYASENPYLSKVHERRGFP